MSFENIIQREFEESIAVKQRAMRENSEVLAAITEAVIASLGNGGKLLLCGNGGSAADAQHIAAEFVARFVINRQAIPAIALTTDSSILTAIANDFSYEDVFSRQVEALGNPGDLFWGISTSGNSPNVLKAAVTARKKGLISIGFTGESGGKLRENCDLCLCVPSTVTARIQEVHITAAHIVCQIAEERLAK